MKSLGILVILALASLTAAQNKTECQCRENKLAACTENAGKCVCVLHLGAQMSNQEIDCTKLTPKCFLMKAEMNKKAGRRKPTEHAFVDNDGIYDPDCEDNGVFKARQNNHSEEYWCVNSAGVRRTDKKDGNLKCSELVKTFWIQIQMKHKEMSKEIDSSKLKDAVKTAITSRYKLNGEHIEKITYEKDSREIFVDLKQNVTASNADIAAVAYYLEKDVKQETLFRDNSNLDIKVDEMPVGIESVLIYYVDEKAPEFSMKQLTAGVIAVIVVIVLAIIAGLVVLVITRKRQSRKPQGRELDEMQKQQLTS
ncbi:epithelial cell adhesion molecule [Latimeria chalumnae]|uniref:Epithelial cell adhesion molecule n=1 Tax=Latimeria chalumnae TaxID=7897 RepID=M3XIQ5_LATCH|nr:PREDICTED: epithelial cell adhesion molecule [Latimeria chalumnae]|eukprot:XP_006012928.1 PREDICTED: epithelial cell adhesion molecule [Latimeria chalumnae]